MSEVAIYALDGTMHYHRQPGARAREAEGDRIARSTPTWVSATATLGAYMGRELQGYGQHVDLSLFEESRRPARTGLFRARRPSQYTAGCRSA